MAETKPSFRGMMGEDGRGRPGRKTQSGAGSFPSPFREAPANGGFHGFDGKRGQVPDSMTAMPFGSRPPNGQATGAPGSPRQSDGRRQVVIPESCPRNPVHPASLEATSGQRGARISTWSGGSEAASRCSRSPSASRRSAEGGFQEPARVGRAVRARTPRASFTLASGTGVNGDPSRAASKRPSRPRWSRGTASASNTASCCKGRRSCSQACSGRVSSGRWGPG